MTSVTIGNSVTSIGSQAFAGCSALKQVTSLNTTPPEIRASTFDEKTEKNAVLNVPAGSKTLYWLHPYWEDFFQINEGIPTTIDAIANEDGEEGITTIYTLDGNVVNTQDIKSLSKGIYIINGKKVIIK